MFCFFAIYFAILHKHLIMAKFTITQFREQFPNEEACLDYLFKKKTQTLTECPECKAAFKYARVKKRRSYQCLSCAHQIYPTADTIFHKSTTPLMYWFYVIFKMTVTRNGVASKEVERELNVCYKTAHRMTKLIRTLMVDSNTERLSGEVVIDETYLGMLGKNMHNDKKKDIELKTGISNKTGVLGMIQKDGKIVTKVLGKETDEKQTLHQILKEHIELDSIVVTDAFPAYKKLKNSFKKHVRIDHTKDEYVKEGYSTNKIENYWSSLKRMIKGTHIHVSREHLSKYVAENSFRYMYRKSPDKMLAIILSRVV